MFDVPGVDEDFIVDSPELIGAWSEHLCDDVWSLPWRRELVAVLVALDEVEYQVPDVQGLTPHSMVVVLVSCLLVPRRAEEGNVVCFI